jgi:8-oxo-dGTP diphosphatase
VISQRDITQGKVMVSVAAVIEGKQHEILLIWEGDVPYHKQWVIPGGYVKPDESANEAILREVKEETGLVTVPKKLVGVYDDFASEKNGSIHHIVIAYTVDVVGGRVVFSQEATAYKWVSVEEALGSPEIPAVFKKVLSDLKKQKRRSFISRLSRTR